MITLSLSNRTLQNWIQNYPHMLSPELFLESRFCLQHCDQHLVHGGAPQSGQEKLQGAEGRLIRGTSKRATGRREGMGQKMNGDQPPVWFFFFHAIPQCFSWQQDGQTIVQGPHRTPGTHCRLLFLFCMPKEEENVRQGDSSSGSPSFFLIFSSLSCYLFTFLSFLSILKHCSPA